MISKAMGGIIALALITGGISAVEGASYIKIGDIKGESSDSSEGTDAQQGRVILDSDADSGDAKTQGTFDTEMVSLDLSGADPTTSGEGDDNDDDIQSTSRGDSDESNMGKAETEFKVEEGEKEMEGDEMDDLDEGKDDDDDSDEGKSKPKEIVVVGSKVRSATPKLQLANCGGTNAVCNPESVETEEDLKEFAGRTAGEDENIESVSFNFEKIKVDYKTQAKLFGILRVTMKESAEIRFGDGEHGRVKVKFPWWSFLAKKQVSIETLESKMEEVVNERQLTASAFENSNERAAQYIEMMSSVMKAKHDIAMNAIRNLK